VAPFQLPIRRRTHCVGLSPVEGKAFVRWRGTPTAEVSVTERLTINGLSVGYASIPAGLSLATTSSARSLASAYKSGYATLDYDNNPRRASGQASWELVQAVSASLVVGHDTIPIAPVTARVCVKQKGPFQGYAWHHGAPQC
jgi:hypothetical protein